MLTVVSDPLIVREKTAEALDSKLLRKFLDREAERNLFWQSVYDRQKELRISSILQSLKDSMNDNNYARFNH